jgi:hypothetical protein
VSFVVVRKAFINRFVEPGTQAKLVQSFRTTAHNPKLASFRDFHQGLEYWAEWLDKGSEVDEVFWENITSSARQLLAQFGRDATTGAQANAAYLDHVESHRTGRAPRTATTSHVLLLEGPNADAPATMEQLELGPSPASLEEEVDPPALWLMGEGSSGPARSGDRMATMQCYECRQQGHIAKDCPTPGSCYVCGATGHQRQDCPISAAASGKVTCTYCRQTGHIDKGCHRARRDKARGTAASAAPAATGDASIVSFLAAWEKREASRVELARAQQESFQAAVLGALKDFREGN